MEGEVAGTYIMPSFGRYEQCAELVRRIRARHPGGGAGVTAFDRASRLALLPGLLRERILVLDGAMGTMLQAHKFTEADFRGERFRDHPRDLRGNSDLLCLTQPAAVAAVHAGYLDAGADILSTNSFTATRIAQADYGFDAETVRDLNVAAARLARDAADAAEAATPDRPRFVAGSLGPTNRTASMSSDVGDPAARSVTWEELEVAYREVGRRPARGRRGHPADRDDLRHAQRQGGDRRGPVAVRRDRRARAADHLGDDRRRLRAGRCRARPSRRSGTASATPIRSSSGSTARSARSSSASTSTSSRASPTGRSRPTRTPASRTSSAATTRRPRRWPRRSASGPGTACSTSPAAAAGRRRSTSPPSPPRSPACRRARSPSRPGRPACPASSRSIIPPPGNAFVNVGERTNVTGSRKFARLVADGAEDEAVDIAREQVTNGAQLIDVNMDEAMLDGVAAMTRFLRRIAAEPDIATVPVMVDSSKWSVIEAGLQQLQGKGVVNSISLKEGEEEFLRQARLCRRYGAAVVVMAFDEQGQAESVERRVAVLRRAYDLLTGTVGFKPEDIILDANIFAIATGMEEHNAYAVSFIEAVRRLKVEFPGTRTSGGVSNVSFAFRGNDRVREAIHSVFLYHAIAAGLDMAIVNAGVLPIYDDIEPELRERVEDVVLNRRPDATERLLDLAAQYAGGAGMERAAEDLAWRERAGRRAPDPRPGGRHRRLHRRGHRGGAARRGSPARRHRGPADGRDERRRRPVRGRPDVPAAGRQERPGHEEGRRRPHPVSRGASAKARAVEPARS